MGQQIPCVDRRELDMRRVIATAREFARNEEGATAIEYGLLASLVAVVIITSVQVLGGSLKTTFDGVVTKLTSGTAP
jgi:pilus assembly protein Flp/PilA